MFTLRDGNVNIRLHLYGLAVTLLMMSKLQAEATRPLRSQPTRDRILTVARECFAAHGFERTTVRMIASAAQVAPAMLIRYYDSKEGLFAAAARIDLRLPDLSDTPFDILGQTLVSHFLDRWEGDRSDGELQALLRASVSHEGARDALTGIFERQLRATIKGTGVGDAPTRAALIASQMLGLALGRYILSLPGLVALDRQSIVALIAPTIQAYLDVALPPDGRADAI